MNSLNYLWATLARLDAAISSRSSPAERAMATKPDNDALLDISCFTVEQILPQAPNPARPTWIVQSAGQGWGMITINGS
jgi:hypothetical protein